MGDGGARVLTVLHEVNHAAICGERLGILYAGWVLVAGQASVLDRGILSPEYDGPV